MPRHDPQMLKGVLGLLLLGALSAGDEYGYGLVVRLRESGSVSYTHLTLPTILLV